MTMDELHGSLIAYEMRTCTENDQSNKEASFKSIKKTKDKEHKAEEKSGYDSDEEEAHFVRNIKRGTKKYKGKLPFKCFNCGRVGHYDKKFPFEEKKRFHKKKGLYSKEDNNSSNENDGEEMDRREVLFITQKNQENDHKV
jgi:hypothetical protein